MCKGDRGYKGGGCKGDRGLCIKVVGVKVIVGIKVVGVKVTVACV